MTKTGDSYADAVRAETEWLAAHGTDQERERRAEFDPQFGAMLTALDATYKALAAPRITETPFDDPIDEQEGKEENA